jgi:hypothetical protein
MRRFLRWCLKWITVLSVTIIGGLLTLFPILLTALSSTDIAPLLTPFMTPETALAVITAIAVLKAMYAAIQAARGKEAEG